MNSTTTHLTWLLERGQTVDAAGFLLDRFPLRILTGAVERDPGLMAALVPAIAAVPDLPRRERLRADAGRMAKDIGGATLRVWETAEYKRGRQILSNIARHQAWYAA